MSSLHRAMVGSQRWKCEFIVFVDVPFGASAGAHVEKLLTALWQVPADDLEIYNVQPAREVIHEEPSDTRDDRALFATCWGHGRTFYAQPDRTMFLVGPRSHKRLLAAQALIVGQGYEQYLDRAAKGLLANYHAAQEQQ